MKNVLKIGLDIHGVIDAFPEKFRLLSRALVRDGAEVHIVTGVKRSAEIEALLEAAGIRFTHYFSIVEYLEGNQERVDWINGLPYADETLWNHAKRNYCEAEGIDLMFDDSPIYRDTFHEIDCTFVHVIGEQRESPSSEIPGKRPIPAAV